MSLIADIFAALNNFEGKQPDDYHIEKKRALAAFIAQELAPTFQAGADAARRECAGIANHWDALSAEAWDLKYEEDSLEQAILARVGQPVDSGQPGKTCNPDL